MRYIILFTFFLLAACQNQESNSPKEAPLFTKMKAADTGIDFINQLDFNREFNIYTYRNFYNGGGVAIGDINNDGLMDIYFTANMKSNRLYLNKGNFQFEDITDQAKVGGTGAWSTGVSMADVNGDGWLDIYVCNSGDIKGDFKQNELFINNGATEGALPTFTEAAESYGIADKGFGTNGAFFDYDKDGDLDMYLLNNSYRSIFDFNLEKKQRPIRDELGGDKFFRNNNGKFVDVSEEVGIYGSEIGFGLGITVSDVNRDGWLDMFISNDFFERDYLYINQGATAKDGKVTFKEDLENQILSVSGASMGADMADINNDGYPEIFVTEMLPEGEARYKTKMTFENWDRYQKNVQNGYYHQFTRNMMQLNNGDGTFSEIGRMLGVEATDWSWGALIADYDNDGNKDLYVCNGLYQDIIDQDYIQFVSNEEIARQMITKEGVNYKKLIDTIPSTLIPNYLFKNKGNLEFENVAAAWGLATPSHSNGSAYADLDNDGDLDLIVNNTNSEAFVYQNEANNLKQNNYLKFQLTGTAKNPFAIGTSISLKAGDQTFYAENIPVRSFQSSVDYRPNFGLGTIEKIDSAIIQWPDNTTSILTDVPVNQTISLEQNGATTIADVTTGSNTAISKEKIFKEITADLNWEYEHKENRFIDFDRDRLIYHMLSTEGPKIAKGDVNGDGLEDFYISGAKGKAGALYIQNKNGQFDSSNEALFERDAFAEEVDCLFFDADNDNDQDLYVTRGGSEYLSNSKALIDQLYINDGQGNFTRSPQFLPTFKFESTACVRAADYDKDGDQDLFVGIRSLPGYYGKSVNGYILNNNGKGIFSNITKQIAPELYDLGMITDLQWIDYDGDDDEDLIVIGEWMPIQVFENDKGRFKKVTKKVGLANTNGWWNCVKAGDFDKDGDLDLVVGNHGLNSRFEASKEKPISLYVNDFDRNGTPEPVISQYNGDKSYPLTLRHDLVMQLPHLKKKYIKYHNYKEQTVQDIFNEKELKGVIEKEVYMLESAFVENNGDGTFSIKALPKAAQFSPVYGLLVEDYDKDGNLDILLGGNLYGVKPEVGRYDANYGLLLKGNGDNTFEEVLSKESGFQALGQVRDLERIKVGDKSLLLVAKNNDKMQVFEME
jgi:hypothetical protein